MSAREFRVRNDFSVWKCLYLLWKWGSSVAEGMNPSNDRFLRRDRLVLCAVAIKDEVDKQKIAEAFQLGNVDGLSLELGPDYNAPSSPCNPKAHPARHVSS